MKTLNCFFSKSLPALFLSALLSALPMTFPSLFFLSWVSFVPFFLVLLKRSGDGTWFRALGRGVFFGFLYHALIYFWFLWLYPLDFAGLDNFTSLLVVLLAWLGISLLHGALFALPTLLCHFTAKIVKNESFLLFTGMLGILAAEWIPTLSELAFPWVRLSLSNYRVPALIQFASVFGIEGVDFLLLLFSALITLLIHTDSKKRKGLFALLAAFLFVSNLAFGLLRLSHKSEGESITVSSVQGCVLSEEKWSGQNAVNTYVSLTEEIEGADLVVWPESAVAKNLATNDTLLSDFQALSRKIDTPILMGCFWKLEGVTSNSAVLLDEDSVSEPYSKRHLVPFGEKMPYRAVLSALFPFLEEINMLSSDLSAGEETAVIDTEKGKAGVIICFESLFPSLVRDSVRDGAEMIFLVTNDSWYKDSPAVWQHLAHAVFRSVENARSTVRCANSGVSALIDERGQITEELGPLQQGVLTGDVSFCDETTLYTRLGEFFLPTVLAFWIVVFAFLMFLERRRENARSK